MKKILLIILILTDTLVIAQFHKNYSWSEKTIITQEIDSSFQKSSIGLLNKYIVEFKDTSDSANTSFDKYLTRHTIVRILAEDGIKYHKTLYIPMYNSDNLIDLKVRIIDSTGNIINFDGSNLYEVENEEFSKNFKTYELTDLMVNSIVECIYTTKEKSEIHGSQILQEDYFNTKTEFILIPNNFKSKVKPYNTNEVFNSELINNVKAKKITINNLNPVSNEEYSTAQANRVNISYQCYKADKISSQSEFWKNITNSIYPIAFPKKYSNELIKLNELIFKIDNSKESNYTTFQKLNRIDNYIKNNFTMLENGNSDLSRLDYILKNKKGSNIGIIQLYSSLLLYNGIDYELLITSNRYYNRLDPDFFNPDNLREILFYIPKEKKYIIPDKFEYRIGEAPFNVLGNYGIYIDKNKDYYFSTIIENDKKYSTINRDITVDFKKMKKVIINETQKYTGHWAITNRLMLDLSNKQTESGFKDYLTTSGIKGKTIIDHSIENNNIFQTTYNNPFIVNSIISSDSIIKSAKSNTSKKKSKKYIFHLGSIIGIQSELYLDKTRVNPIEIRYPNYYKYNILINIPRGYKVEDLEKININKNYISNAAVIAKFESSFKIEGNTLFISIEEFYKSLNYSKFKYNDFRNVINAAADFNKLEISFVRK
ncbi:DUF3857 domain-containing protein [Flavobacteriaceae bacterium]|nr:DUF3857 domain-containing protein [Flavobacteriaceae bacterium]MDC1491943.1 DUF3857 domain-containing protein [Flavobacteriaceae bacterium]